MTKNILIACLCLITTASYAALALPNVKIVITGTNKQGEHRTNTLTVVPGRGIQTNTTISTENAAGAIKSFLDKNFPIGSYFAPNNNDVSIIVYSGNSIVSIDPNYFGTLTSGFLPQFDPRLLPVCMGNSLTGYLEAALTGRKTLDAYCKNAGNDVNPEILGKKN